MAANLPDTFTAFRIFDDENGHRAELVEQSIDEQSEGDVIVRVEWSSVNYKDALAGTGKGRILRRFPLNGGIDAAGTVVRSDSDDFSAGDQVLITGSGLSETRDGGYSEYLRLPSEWLVPLPDSLSTQEAMVIGTAGFTAALGLWRMENNGQTPDDGPIVVTGASGGGGSPGVGIYSAPGYQVSAISGKEDEFDWLHELGAEQCISRHELYWPESPLASARFAGALDNVGGDMLSGLTRVIQPWGNIASCGMAGGIGLKTTVMPFIIRGIALLGINTASCSIEVRREMWQRLGGDWRPRHLDKIAAPTVRLEERPGAFDQLLEARSRGRIAVQVAVS